MARDITPWWPYTLEATQAQVMGPLGHMSCRYPSLILISPAKGSPVIPHHARPLGHAASPCPLGQGKNLGTTGWISLAIAAAGVIEGRNGDQVGTQGLQINFCLAVCSPKANSWIILFYLIVLPFITT